MKTKIINKTSTPILAILVLILFGAAAILAQPTLNVWRSNGPNANIRAVIVDPSIRTSSMRQLRRKSLLRRMAERVGICGNFP